MATVAEGTTAEVTVDAGKILTMSVPGRARVTQQQGLSSAGMYAAENVSGEHVYAAHDMPLELTIEATQGATEYVVSYPLVVSDNVEFRRNDSGAIDALMDGDTAIPLASEPSGSVAWGDITGVPARLNSAQAAGTASIRALGTGAQAAAPGNHTHAASAITASVVGPGSATDVQGILEELNARINSLESPS